MKTTQQERDAVRTYVESSLSHVGDTGPVVDELMTTLNLLDDANEGARLQKVLLQIERIARKALT